MIYVYVLIIGFFFLFLGYVIGIYTAKKVIFFRIEPQNWIDDLKSITSDLLESSTSYNKIDRLIYSFLNKVSAGNIFYVLLLRHDGYFLVNVLNNEIIYDEKIKDILLTTKSENLKERKYFSLKENSFLLSLLDYAIFKRKPDRLIIYYDFIKMFKVKYIALFFYKKGALNRYNRKYLKLLRTRLSFLVFLKEMLGQFKENQEFINRIFLKNPIPMCVTDREGKIEKANYSFSNFFTEGLDRITDLIDSITFSRIIDGYTQEKDSFYRDKNIKLYGVPLYGNKGVVKGGIFSFIDESLQYMLLKKLEISEERYKKFLKELPIGLVILNNEGLIYFVNDNFAISVGISDTEKILGTFLQDYFEFSSDDFSNIVKKMQQQDFLYLKLNLKQVFGNKVFSVHLQKILLGDIELIEATFQDISVEDRLYSQLEEKTKLMEEELVTAKKVWNHILSIPPLYSSLMRFETFFKPSTQLGGDFCDIIQIDDYNIGVIMADVSGHGVSASLLTAMLKMLVEFSPGETKRIDEIINYLNIVLNRILPEDQYITLFYGILDLKNYVIEYINCGHPSPLLYDEESNSIKPLEGMTYPLGVRKNITYSGTRKTINLPSDCKILFYTDGLLSFRKESGLICMEDIEKIFEESVHLRTKQILNNIYMRVLKSSSQFSDDDVSMLLVILNKDLIYKKFLSIPSNVLEIDNAILKMTESIDKIIFLSDEAKWKMYTALYEAMINAIEHGNKYGAQKRVHINYRIYKNWIIFKVRDEGVGFNYKNLPDPLDDNNILKPSGRGIYIIKKVADKIHYNIAGNEITIFINLSENSSK